MKSLLLIGFFLVWSCASVAQSAPTPGVALAMDTAAYGAFCRTLAAAKAAQAARLTARKAQPYPHDTAWSPPACVDGHRDGIIRRVHPSEVKSTGCLVLINYEWRYYCTLHKKDL